MIFFKEKPLILDLSIRVIELRSDDFPSALEITVANKNNKPLQIVSARIEYNPDDLSYMNKRSAEESLKRPGPNLLDCSHPLYPTILKYLNEQVAEKIELSVLFPNVSYTWVIKIPLFAKNDHFKWLDTPDDLDVCSDDWDAYYEAEAEISKGWRYYWKTDPTLYNNFYFPPLVLYIDSHQGYEYSMDFVIIGTSSRAADVFYIRQIFPEE